jgi:hypothetical protein
MLVDAYETDRTHLAADTPRLQPQPTSVRA